MGAAAAAVSFAPGTGRAQRARTDDELVRLSLAQAAALVRSGEVSPVELAQACLARIERLNPTLNAFITVRGADALADARRAEAEIRAGRWRGPLHGIPIGLKDNIDTAGVRTTGASELFKDRVPSEDADVARRLKAAGAVLLGKLNLHEFAYGGSSTTTHYGTMRNPWNIEHATGGSSGGSAVAIAADLCYAALGTDTAGSVRMPASHCGIVGLKPTYGRVSTRGVMVLSWTLDHVGPLCKTIEDAAIVLNVIAGYDPLEPTTSERAVPDYTRDLRAATTGLRLGIPRAYFDGIDTDVAAASSAAIEVLERITASVRDVELPRAVSGARLWGPEAYAYHREWITATPERYQPSTRRSLERYAQADALDYVQARREVDLLRQQVGRSFADVDLLIAPVMRTPAPPIAASEGGGGGGGGSAGTGAFNVFGLPGISVPCGFSAAGLPIGLQIVGAPFAEASVLRLAHAYEQATDWKNAEPKLDL